MSLARGSGRSVDMVGLPSSVRCDGVAHPSVEGCLFPQQYRDECTEKVSGGTVLRPNTPSARNPSTITLRRASMKERTPEWPLEMTTSRPKPLPCGTIGPHWSDLCRGFPSGDCGANWRGKSCARRGPISSMKTLDPLIRQGRRASDWHQDVPLARVESQ